MLAFLVQAPLAAATDTIKPCCETGVLSSTTASPIRNAENKSLDGRRYRPIPIDPSGPPEVLLQKLWLTEGRNGPYAPELIPDLVDLGAAYFAEEAWDEAVETFGRAIHLQRLNGGLYTEDQIGIVEQVIEAHLQQADYRSVDDKQGYLYRVQSKLLSARDPRMVAAVERQADWHRAAYLGHLDRIRYPRIVKLMDLYADMEAAARAETEVPTRAEMPYLAGRLRTVYLLSLYSGERNDGGEPNDDQIDEGIPDLTRLRFGQFYGDNFRNGVSTIEKMEELLLAVGDATPQELADIEVLRGDWYQWNRQHALAISAYEKAWSMVEGANGAAAWRKVNFGAPQELPKQRIFSQGLMPVRVYDKGMLHARFEVTRLGEAKDIDIVAPTADENQPAVTRGYKFVRNMRFRPRVEDGKVVVSSDVERIYTIRY